ncbi:MAG: hypothetical protein ACP5E3_06580 [Bacteroidales bacterium]
MRNYILYLFFFFLGIQIVYAQTIESNEWLKKEILKDVKKSWSDFDTAFHKIYFLIGSSENINNENEKNIQRFIYTPGYIHRFYLASYGEPGFRCSLSLYRYNPTEEIEDTLLFSIIKDSNDPLFVSSEYKIGTSDEYLLKLDILTKERGIAVGLRTIQIQSNDSIRRQFYYRNLLRKRSLNKEY